MEKLRNRCFYDYRVMDRDMFNKLSIIRYKVLEYYYDDHIYRIAAPVDSNYGVDLTKFPPVFGTSYRRNDGTIKNAINMNFFGGAFQKATLQRCGTCIAVNIQEGYEKEWAEKIQYVMKQEIPDEPYPKEWGDYRYEDVIS